MSCSGSHHIVTNFVFVEYISSSIANSMAYPDASNYNILRKLF